MSAHGLGYIGEDAGYPARTPVHFREPDSEVVHLARRQSGVGLAARTVCGKLRDEMEGTLQPANCEACFLAFQIEPDKRGH